MNYTVIVVYVSKVSACTCTNIGNIVHGLISTISRVFTTVQQSVITVFTVFAVVRTLVFPIHGFHSFPSVHYCTANPLWFKHSFAGYHGAVIAMVMYVYNKLFKSLHHTPE